MKCIDNEYGAPNYSAYDIANHFNEFCGVDEVDFNLYPSKGVQLEYIRTYLTQMNSTPPTDEVVEQWYRNIEIMSLLSHLYWGIWAQIEAANSAVDFNFMGYGVLKLDEYFRRKDIVIGK